MTTLDTQRTNTTPATTAPAASGRPPAQTDTRRQQKTRGTTAIGVALVALGGLTGLWWDSTRNSTVPVLVLAQDVEAGQPLTREDLAVTSINPDSRTSFVSPDRADTVVGRYPKVNLAKGTLVASQLMTSYLNAGTGKSVVGVAVKPTQIPSTGLQAGDEVRVVATQSENNQGPAENPAFFAGTVQAVGPSGDDGSQTVDVVVPAGSADDLAALAGSGRVAILLDRPVGASAEGSS